MLVSRFLHPIKVEIIEAWIWIDKPMASSDLHLVFDCTYYLSMVDYHVKGLAKVGVLRGTGHKKVRGATKHFYVLAKQG